MNNVILPGRLCADPEAKYDENGKPRTKYTLAVDRRFKRDGGPTADFIPCVTFGRNAEFAEEYLKKGMKIMVEGEIQTGSYKDKEGETIYTWNVIVSTHEFCESKKSQEENNTNAGSSPASEEQDFVNVPDSDLEELPFN